MSTDLTKYKDASKYNLLVKPEDLKVSPLLNVELSVVQIDSRDVRQGGETHNIGGQLSPSRSALDKIADATGITFDERYCGTRKEGDGVWVGKAVGRRKNPDGTYRTGVCEYELDIEVRAEEIRGRQKDKDKAEKEILQLKKFGRQRADTGARLRVIRELTGLKTGFPPGELNKPFVFARYTVNVKAMMDDPAMKQAAINQALGVHQDIYGSAEVRDVTPKEEAAALPEPETKEENNEDPGPDFDDIPFGDPEPPKFTPEVEEARNWLLEVSGLPDVPKDTQAWIKDFLNGKSDKDGTDIDTLIRIQKTIRKNVPALAGDTT